MSDNPSNVNEFVQLARQYGLEYFGLYYGTYRGFVVDNADGEKLGRLKLRVPQIAGDNVIDYWAWPKGQVAGDDFGDFFIPPNGSCVWVEFENGDPRHPIWVGGHWGKSAGVVPAEGKLGDPGNRVRKSENWIFEMNDIEDYVKISSKDNAHNIKIYGNGNIDINGSGVFTKTTGAHNDAVTGDRTASATGNEVETVGGNATKTVTGALTLVAAALAATIAGTGTITIGGVTMVVTGGGSGLDLTYSGSTLKFTGSDIEIMARNFLSHTHSGVQAGGGVTGGVV